MRLALLVCLCAAACAAAEKSFWEHFDEEDYEDYDEDTAPSPRPTPSSVLCVTRSGAVLCAAAVGCCGDHCCGLPPPAPRAPRHFFSEWRWVQVLAVVGIFIGMLMVGMCFSLVVKVCRRSEAQGACAVERAEAPQPSAPPLSRAASLDAPPPYHAVAGAGAAPPYAALPEDLPAKGQPAR